MPVIGFGTVPTSAPLPGLEVEALIGQFGLSQLFRA